MERGALLPTPIGLTTEDLSTPWKASALKPRMHFINCHSGPADFHFCGQRGRGVQFRCGPLQLVQACAGHGICNRNLLDGALVSSAAQRRRMGLLGSKSEHEAVMLEVSEGMRS